MQVLLAEQTQAFLYAALLGALLGLVYDLLRTLRIILGSGKVLTAGLDLLFCLAAAASFFALTLVYAQGQVRSYTVGGAILGAALYFSGLSPLALSILGPVARFLHHLPGCIRKRGQNLGHKDGEKK